MIEWSHVDETPIRILIIEDDAELRRVLVTLLEAEGYLVTAAEGGRQAVQAASQAGFDLVVADIRMKEMDGLEALEAIQQGQPDARSMVITGYSTEADSIRAIRLGVSEYLTKPFRLDSFLDAINAIVAKRRRELERRAERDRLRTTLLWATRLVASYSDKHTSSQLRPLLETARLAARVARRTGMADIAVDQVQLATLLAGLGLGLTPQVSAPGEPAPSIPPAILRILGSLEERWDGDGGPEGLVADQIPAESRLVAAALATRELPAGEHAAALERLDPGRFDPQALKSLDQREVVSESAQDMTSAKRRGLLTLGRAMEEVANLAAATEAYGSVARCPNASREQVEALVALFRLEGDREFAEKALHQGEQVGPWTQSWAALQLGLAGRKTCPQEAARWIRTAGRLYSQMGDARGKAGATLALATVSAQVPLDSLEEAAKTVLRAENRGMLADVAGWVLPFVLGLETLTEPLERLAKRAMWEAPGSMRRLLQLGLLGKASRLRAVEILQTMGADAPADILHLLACDIEPSVQAAAEELNQNAGAQIVPLLRFFSLGPFETYLGDQRVREDEWKTQKIKALMAMLAERAGQPLAQDLILQTFWPGDPDKGKQSLYWSTAVLRKILEPLHEDSKLTVVRRRKALCVNPDLPQWHDLEELRRMAAQAREKVESKSSEWHAYRCLLELYRGPYLEEFDHDWVAEVRSQVGREVGTVLLAVSRLALSGSQPETALEFSSRLAELEPLNTEASLTAMQAQSALGRYAQAVQRFEELSRRLKERDMEPSIPLVEAYERAKLSV